MIGRPRANKSSDVLKAEVCIYIELHSKYPCEGMLILHEAAQLALYNITCPNIPSCPFLLIGERQIVVASLFAKLII